MNTNLKPIPGFPDYSITRDGRVWSKTRRTRDGRNLNGKWLNPWVITCLGHLGVVLTRGRVHKYKQIHRLVLEAFVGPCPEGMECRHLDGDPTNNHVDNLKWGTKFENQADRVLHGTSNRGTRCAASKLDEMDVHFVRAWLKLGYKQKGITEAFGIGSSAISNIKKGRNWGWLRNLDGSPYVGV